MKRKSYFSGSALLAFCWLLVGLLPAEMNAALWYWDPNGASTPTSGTWNTTTAQWATTSALTATPSVWNSTMGPSFAAGTTPIANMTITVNSAINEGGIFNGSFGGVGITNLVITGTGSLNQPSSAQGFNVGNASWNTIIRVPITGVGPMQTGGSGSLYLSTNNTFTAGVQLSTGAGLNFNNGNAFGTGPITNAVTSTVLATVGVDSTGTVFNTNSIINITNSFSTYATSNSSTIFVGIAAAPVIFSGPFNLAAPAGTNYTFQNQPSGTTVNISGTISGAQNFIKTGAGTLTNSGPNTYGGKTTINNGVLSISSFNRVSGGAASSSLGHPTTVPLGTIAIGSSTTAATLVYTGAGETTDRVIDLSGTTGGATIQNDGSGPLLLTNTLTVSGAGIKTLTLSGSNTATNTIGKIVNNSGVNTTGVTKSGAGTWILTEANTYTGTTTLSSGGGVLGIGDPAALSTGPFVVSGNSSFDNLTGGDITINNVFTLSGGSPTYVGSANNMTINGVVTISGANRTVTVTAHTLTLGGVIGQDASARNFTKAGAGAMVLTATSTNTGTTVVSAGLLALATGGGMANSTVTVSSGASLSNATTTVKSIGGNLGLPTGGKAAFTAVGGGSPAVGKLSIAGNLTNNNNVLTVNVTGSALPPGTYPLMECAGNCTGSANPTPVIVGTPLAAGNSAVVVTTTGAAGHVDLIVRTDPTFSGLTNSQSVVYGTPSILIGGTLATADPIYPAMGDTVTVTINGNAQNTTINDATGDFAMTYTLPANLPVSGSPYTIKYTYAGNNSLLLGTATNTSTTLSVTPATLTVTARGSLTYGDDPTNAVYIPSYATLVGTDTVAVITGSANFSTDATATNYVGSNYLAHVVDTGMLASPNYAFVAGPDGVFTITTRSLQVTDVLALDKVYDGTTNVSLVVSNAGLSGLVNGDEASVSLVSSNAVGGFTNKNVGVGKTVTTSGFATGGDLGTNYIVIQPTLAASISALAITVTAATDTKVYDGTTNSTGVPTSIPALAPGDTGNFTQAFANRDAGMGKNLIPAGTVTDGNGGTNYSITFANNTTGEIDPKPIAVTAVTNTKFYDGTTNAAAVPNVSPAVIAGDVAMFTEAYTNKNVGTGKTLVPSGSVSDGNGGLNYSVSFVNNTTGQIDPKAITVTAATNTKVYDGTTSAVAVPGIAPGLVAGDTPNFIETYDTKDVGTGKTLTPSGVVIDGNGGANYGVTFVDDTTGVISNLATLLSLGSSANPAAQSASVIFTASVAGTPPAADSPTGNIVFSANGVPFATNALSSGSATATNASLPLGTNAMSAVYLGDANFLGSTGSLSQVISNSVVYSTTNAIVSLVNNLDGTFTLSLQGTAGAQYYVVSSQDVSTPVSAWTPVAGSTNTAPGPSGAWSLVVSNPAPAYYESVAVNPAP